MSDCPVSVLRRRMLNLTCKKLVVETCIQYPSCTGDDVELCLRVNQRLGVFSLADYFHQLKERKAYSFETIERRRREALAEVAEKLMPELIEKGYSVEEAMVLSRSREFGNFLAPTLATQEKRAKREVVFKEYYSPNGGSKTEAGFVNGLID